MSTTNMLTGHRGLPADLATIVADPDVFPAVLGAIRSREATDTPVGAFIVERSAAEALVVADGGR